MTDFRGATHFDRLVYPPFFSFLLLLALVRCDSPQANINGKLEKEKQDYPIAITNLSDEEYPDDPDIGYRSVDYQNDYFLDARLIKVSDENKFQFDFEFNGKNGDIIHFHNLDLSEFIPTIPSGVSKDEYLSYISCINQEWNRNQVRFSPDYFESNNSDIVRVDMARNCLNAYLWEVIFFTEEDEKVVPYSHGWFDFPHELYSKLFQNKNGVTFDTYQKPLENWVDPESKKIDLGLLRTILDSMEIETIDLSDEMYPVAGAREKKFKEIIFPTDFSSMRDLQTDSALFATFSPPGFYNRADPRTTELGRFHHLQSSTLCAVSSLIKPDTLSELTLNFRHRNDSTFTTLVFGGLDFTQFPVLSVEEANSGWKSSMGIGNHPFYETYQEHIALPAGDNPYYALLLDSDGKWLDSHKVGIDGPIFHFADEERTELHLWLLSFERHALVGHYVFN
jgi:hypothetical protein